MQTRLTEHGKEPRHIRTFLTVAGSGASRTLLLNVRNEFGHSRKGLDGEETLGRFHGRIRVTAEKKRIFSSIRERLDRMEKSLGVGLRFVVEEERSESAGKKVTLTCCVYEPAKPGASEFAGFKRD